MGSNFSVNGNWHLRIRNDGEWKKGEECEGLDIGHFLKIFLIFGKLMVVDYSVTIFNTIRLTKNYLCLYPSRLQENSENSLTLMI